MKGKKASILIVEDLRNWQEVFSSILKDEYEVQVAGSYDQAIQLLEDDNSSFELVITDIRLDDSNVMDESGFRLLEEVGKSREYISTIVVTGYPTLETVRKALHDFDAFDYIEKYPSDGEFSIVQFRDTVSKAIDNTKKRRAIAQVAKSAVS
jgi:DNA-binding NtrC family response regulator